MKLPVDASRVESEMQNPGENEPAASELSRRIAIEAMEITSEACSVSLDDLKAPKRQRAKVAFARQLAMYLCHVIGQIPMSEISIVFQRDRTTVSYACHIIEDRRDSAFFNAQIEFMENAMRERMQIVFAQLLAPRVNSHAIRRARAALAR